MARKRAALITDLIWRLEALGFDLLTAVIRALPVDWVSAAGGRLFRVLGPLTRAHQTARDSLRLAFPDMDEGERGTLLTAQWDNFGRYVAEFPVVDKLTPRSGRVSVVGADRLATIAASGKPVVFVSGHFANLEVMPATILEAGIDCDMTYRAANNPHVDDRIRRSRARYGVRLFAPKGEEGARELLAALKRGQSVAMMNDQKYDGGVAAPFFGREVYTLPAAVRLALRFGTSIQPMSVQRLEGARFRCVVHEPIVVENTGDRVADITRGVAAINAFMEARIRERPGEWWWLHRRWPASAYAELAASDASRRGDERRR
ncbi:MAG TPA: lysophospholipid acyltransferase family protein [Caulobacteraceae bacterium]